MTAGCAQQTFTVQNKPAAVAPKRKPSPIISSFLELVKKTVDAAKICGGAENVVKTETQQTFVNGLLGFITLGIYPLGSACIAHNNCGWVAHRYGQLYLHCSLIYFGFLPVVFAYSDHLSECEIIPFSGVCQFWGGCIIHAGGGGFTHWLTDCFDVQNWRRPAATSSRRASFSASSLASANPSCILHRAQGIPRLTHLHVSNCRVRQLQFSGIFVALGFVGTGVITVMINSPWQADDDADNQSGDNRGDSAHTSISLTVPPASLNFAIRPSALCSNWPHQRPAVKPRYCCNGRIGLTDITTINHR